MKRVIIESPYAGEVERNELYLSRALADSLHRKEAPFASHGLYTRPGVLADSDKKEREMGIQAGFQWTACADMVAVYIDYGLSPGMERGIRYATQLGLPVERRSIGVNPSVQEAAVKLA